MQRTTFFIGDWQANPNSNTVMLAEKTIQLEPLAMDVLFYLCSQHGEVVSAEQLVQHCWGSDEIPDNALHKVITQLRKAFGDKASAPQYIETIRKRGYRIVAPLHFALDEEQKAATVEWSGGSPYPGLGAFSGDDSAMFYGRHQQTSDLLDVVVAGTKQGRALTLVLGPSGSGKSSLIQAGVLPHFRAQRGYSSVHALDVSVLDFADVSPGQVMLELASLMLDWEVVDRPVFEGESAETLARRLVEDIPSVIGQCQRARQLASGLSGHVCFCLFLDRMEVLLSSDFFTPQQRAQCLQLAKALSQAGLAMVIAACRNEFYADVVKQPVLLEAKQQQGFVDLLPPSRAEIMQMIRLPAKAAGLVWQTDPKSGISLDELLGDEAAANPDSLPMLQYTLAELYERREHDQQMSMAVYRELGGIEGAIGKKAEQIYAQFPIEQQQALGFVMSRLVTLSDASTNLTSRAGRWHQLQNQHQRAFVQAMVDNRLFVSHLLHDQACFSLAHEALLRSWQRASDWLVEHQQSLAVNSRLQQQSARWIQEQRQPAFLLANGKPLQEAQTLIEQTGFSVDEQVREFISASAKKEKRRQITVRATWMLLLMLTVTTGWMSFRSQQAEQLAQQQRMEAESLMGFMVGDFADKLRSVRRMDLLDGISSKAIEYFTEQPHQSGWWQAENSLSQQSRLQHAQTLMAMGEVAYSRGNQAEAAQAFDAAGKILHTLLKSKADDLDLLKMSGASAFWLGQLDFEAGEFASARQYFVDYLGFSQRMLDIEPDNIDSMTEMSYSLNTLGSLDIQQQQYEQAQQYFARSLQYKQQILSMTPEPGSLAIELADTLSWLATTAQHLGQPDEAKVYFSQGQQQLEQLLEQEPDNAYVIELLAFNWWNHADLLASLMQHQQANQFVQRALILHKQLLAQDSGNEVWQSLTKQLQIKQLFFSAKAQLSDKEALMEQHQAIALSESEWVNQDVATLVQSVQFYQTVDEWQKSGELLEALFSQLTPTFESNQHKLNWGILYLSRAKQFARKEQYLEKSKACNQAINVLQEISKLSKDPKYLLPYVQAHDCIEKSEKVSGHIEQLENMGIRTYRF